MFSFVMVLFFEVTDLYFLKASSHSPLPSGRKTAGERKELIKRRISQRSATNPAALACTMQLPIAVASEGPATTGMFITFAVN